MVSLSGDSDESRHYKTYTYTANKWTSHDDAFVSERRPSLRQAWYMVRYQKGSYVIYVTAAGRRADNTWLNFVRSGSNPAGPRAGSLRQPGLLR